MAYRRVSVSVAVTYDVVVHHDEEHPLVEFGERILADLRDTVSIKSGYAVDAEPGDVVFACSSGVAFDGGSPDCSTDLATFAFDAEDLDPEAVRQYAAAIQAERP